MSSRNYSHTFSQVPQADIQRSSFDRSHTLKTTFNSSLLIPVFIDEALPGDTFNLSVTAFTRMATLKRAIMDNLYLDFHFFAVPNRLVWDHWEEFCGATVAAPGNVPPVNSYIVPKLINAPVPAPPLPDVAAPYPVQSIFDYFGLPLKSQFSVNVLPFRAYNLIWNEWYRDENLQSPRIVSTGDFNEIYQPYNVNQYRLLPRNKRHDYFTSALPWPQKGPSVPIGMSGTGLLPVIPLTNPSITTTTYSGTPINFVSPIYSALSTTNLTTYNGSLSTRQLMTGSGVTTAGLYNVVPNGGINSGLNGPAYWPAKTGLQVDITSSGGFTINSLRQSFQIQKMFERDARGGTRYIEILKSHFGVTSPDARLQRPEYLGGGKTFINVNPIVQTSPGYDGTVALDKPIGTLGGIASGATHNVGFTKSFVEHCYIIGLASVRQDQTYQQGLNRLWTRTTRFDFYWPALAHLGEQAIFNREIFLQGNQVKDITVDPPVIVDDQVFGYQERYAEYRYKPSLVTGLFRSCDVAYGEAGFFASLDNWHLAQDFATLPLLNSSFIAENIPTDRVVISNNDDFSDADFLSDMFFKLRCVRPMPVYGVPGLMDHF
jgi:hypothetical protein